MSFTSPVTPGPITCSQKLWPTCPLELPIPLGCCGERDNKSRRADARVDAATITTLALAAEDLRVPLWTNPTPRAFLVFGPKHPSCAIELLWIVRCPVSMAG